MEKERKTKADTSIAKSNNLSKRLAKKAGKANTIETHTQTETESRRAGEQERKRAKKKQRNRLDNMRVKKA